MSRIAKKEIADVPTIVDRELATTAGTEDKARVDPGHGLAKPHLTAKHLADLRGSGLSDEQIAKCGFYSERDQARVVALLGWKGKDSKLGDCLVIPYVDENGQRLQVRLKPDRPRAARTDQVIKYESPLKSSIRVYIPPFTRTKLQDAATDLLITEGEKKSAKADQEGFVCVGLGGVDAWSKSRQKDDNGKPNGPRRLIDDLDSIPVSRRNVCIVFDSDATRKPAVRRAQRQLGKVMFEKKAIVRIIAIPDGPEGPDGKPIKRGLDDFILAEGVDKFRELLAATPAAREADLVDDDRSKIWVSPQEFRVNNAAAAALAEDPNIYQRDRQLVRIARKSGDPAANGAYRAPTPHIEELKPESLREMLTERCKFVIYKKVDGELAEKEVHIPAWCVGAVCKKGEWPSVPYLDAIVEYPVLRVDGAVLQKAGYDEATHLYFSPSIKVPTVADKPTRDEAIEAAAIIFEVVADFPFASKLHKSAWLAALLTPLARFAFHGPSPLFLVDSNVRGAGKGLLSDVISLIVTGREFSAATYPANDEDELKKMITSYAIAGERMVLLDDLPRNFGNNTMNRVLTATRWQDRRFKAQEMTDLPLYTVWYATGNNVPAGADLVRRICHIRLESPLEYPEERRGFKHRDLRDYVLANRGKLLEAALTILRAYIVAGRPSQPLSEWGSYEGWSDAVRAPLVWLGLPDPGQTRNELRENSDSTSQGIAALLKAMAEIDPERHGKTAGEWAEVTASQAEYKEVFEMAFREPTPRCMGNTFKAHWRRNFDGLKLEKKGTYKGSILWAAVNAADLAPRFSDSPDSPDSPILGESGESGESVSPQDHIENPFSPSEKGPYGAGF